MAKKYRVTLTDDERSMLTTLISSGSAPARTLTHARILLKADQAEGGPAWTDEAIHEALDVGLSTIARVRERFVEHSLEAALHRRSSSRHRQRLLDGARKPTCSPSPVVRRPRAASAGPCACSPTKWSSWSTSTISRMKPCAKSSKKRTQAMVEGGMVFPPSGECRVCLCHGRCARCLSSAGGPTLSHRLLR